MTALIPAIRNALDVLGITPPGHRDDQDDVLAKLAAWQELSAALAVAEAALATGHHEAIGRLAYAPDSLADRGHLQAVTWACEVVGAKVCTTAPPGPRCGRCHQPLPPPAGTQGADQPLPEWELGLREGQ